MNTNGSNSKVVVDLDAVAMDHWPQIDLKLLGEKMSDSRGASLDCKYACSKCKAKGVKLWREYQTWNVELLCVKCTEEISGKKHNLPKTDQIGWYIPAVPMDGENRAYWGYCAVPEKDAQVWRNLPLVI